MWTGAVVGGRPSKDSCGACGPRLQVPALRRISFARRDSQALKTAAAGIVVQAVVYMSRLAVVPLSLRLLGSEQYGLWLAVGSLIAWGGVADLGLAPGLVNLVATASGDQDRQAMRRYISTALAAYSLLGVTMAAAMLGISQWSALTTLLGVKTTALSAEARMLVLVCGLIFAAQMVTRVVPTACTALQEGYLGAWPQIAGSIGGLVLLAVFLWTGSSLFSYALAIGLPPLAAQAGLGLYFFGRRHRDIRPTLRCCDFGSIRALWAMGGPLTLHQIAQLAVLYSATVLIANRLGPAEVTQYSVPYSLFSILLSVSYYVVSPYLPAYAEAFRCGELNWVRRRWIYSLGFTLALLAAGGILIVTAGPSVISLWTGRTVRPHWGFLLALCCFAVFKACSNTNSVLLSGIGKVKFLGGVYAAVAAAYVIGAWVLLPRWGLIAVPAAGALAHLGDAAVSFPYVWRCLSPSRIGSEAARAAARAGRNCHRSA